MHRSVNSPSLGKWNLPGSWLDSQKIVRWSFAQYRIKLLKFACKFPAVLAGSSCRCQAPPVLSQRRSVSLHPCKRAAQLSRDSTTSPPHSAVWSWAGRRGMEKSHQQYGNAGCFWTVDLINALPGAFRHNLRGRHVHHPHCTERTLCSQNPSVTDGHLARKWQRWNSNPTLNPQPTYCALHQGVWAVDDWENGKTGVSNLRETVFIINACIRLSGALIYYVTSVADSPTIKGKWVLMTFGLIISKWKVLLCSFRHLFLKKQSWGSLYLTSISLHGLQSTHDFQREKEKTVPNQPTKQQTHQPKPQPLGSLQSHEYLRQFIPEKEPLWRPRSTLCSRLESLNISENGLICSLLNLSPLRKSMVCSILLLISSGPDWTCKACARWFGSRFIEFLVRAARV